MYASATAGDGGVWLRQKVVRPQQGGGKRGEITAFSKASRRRLIERLMFTPWKDYALSDRHRANARLVLVTLTYPRNFPVEFQAYKRHLDSFAKSLKRARRGTFGALWRLEFQKRGAPHFHILIAFEEYVAVTRLRDWCLQTWFRVVGSGDRRHLLHGADARPVYLPHSGTGGLTRYLVKYLGKLDTSVGRPGRIWGEWGQFPYVVRSAVIFESRQGWVEFLRRVRRWGKKSRYLRRLRWPSGVRLYGYGHGILTQLIKDLPGVLLFAPP